jgi:hypothetical protein
MLTGCCCAAAGSGPRPSSAIPLPASRISLPPSESSSSTRAVLPPWRRVRLPGREATRALPRREASRCPRGRRRWPADHERALIAARAHERQGAGLELAFALAERHPSRARVGRPSRSALVSGSPSTGTGLPSADSGPKRARQSACESGPVSSKGAPTSAPAASLKNTIDCSASKSTAASSSEETRLRARISSNAVIARDFAARARPGRGRRRPGTARGRRTAG